MKFPNLYYEKIFWGKGYKIVAGLDEVGRGCFAGPVVAAAVSFAPILNRKFSIPSENGKKIIINDSKKLSARQRKFTDMWIRENALTYGMGEASVAEINRLGLSKATSSAFRRAVADANIRLRKRISFLLIDAFYIPYIRGFPMRYKKARKNHSLKDTNSRQLAIINGDEKSISISAASIIAKVYRDNLMLELANKVGYTKYGWGRNKGYGTSEHRSAILKYGASRNHRKAVIDTFFANKNP